MHSLLNSLVLAQNGEGGIGIGMILFWVLIFGVFYFILIRPQQKQQKEHRKLISELKAGDHIVTIGGFKGVITQAKEDGFKVRLAPEVEMEIIKSAVGRRQGDEPKKKK